MNQLDPHLKRLFTWTHRGSPAQPEAAPFGFAGRVVALRKTVKNGSLLFELKQLAWTSACVSLAVIICGAALLISQGHAPEPVTGLPTALSFLVSNLFE
jgi:hypothetical protein